jgi:ABC-2 type transport system permease protein
VSLRHSSWQRISALARKDAGELIRNPGAIVPPLLMLLGALLPAFVIVMLVPMLEGESLEESGELVEQATAAIRQIPELAALSGNALIQAFVFHQFSLLLLLVPVVGASALATHAIIGEKQSRALEPILATPISTVELLIAKTLTPFVFALILTWLAAGLYLVTIVAGAEPGVWRAVLGQRTVLLFGVLGPLIELASLQVSVIVSSRSNDARSAQQLTALLILPITIVFVGQLMGILAVGMATLWLGSLGLILVNGLLLWVGVRVFQRETILTRWR